MKAGTSSFTILHSQHDEQYPQEHGQPLFEQMLRLSEIKFYFILNPNN